MPYLALVLVLSLTVALHLWWRRRWEVLRFQVAREQESSAEALRKQEEESARMLAEQQALFNSMAEGVLVLDREGRVELVNKSLEHYFLLKADVRGQTIMEALRLQELNELIHRLSTEESVGGYELELPSVAGCWLEVNAAAIRDRNGAQRGAIVVFHDLTRLRQLENTRQEFVANVSHELRTPLSMIKGFVETLQDGAKKDPELVDRFLDTIEKHTNRLTYLIEDLLTISKLEGGQVMMNFHPVELQAEVRGVIGDLESKAAAKNVRMENRVPAELIGEADADRLQQVLFNLVENAIKYGRADGSVVVGGGSREDGMVELWVRDDGPGIPSESRDRVFERFFRVDRARSRETGGTGLGLAIVKHIIQAHGGKVWVESDLGKGAAFHFTLRKAE